MPTNPLKAALPKTEERSPKDIYECLEWANARLTPEQAALFRYEIVDGKLQHTPSPPFPLAKRNVMDRRGEPMTATETDELNYRLMKHGANVRYRPDGSRYAIGADDA